MKKEFTQNQSASRVSGNSGEPFPAAKVRMEIPETEHRTVKRDLEEFSCLLDNLPDMLFRVNSNLRVEYANQAVAKYTGTSSNSFPGKSLEEINFSEPVGESWPQRVRQVFLSGNSGSFTFEWFTVRGIRFFQTDLVPEKGAEGEVRSVLIVCRDITEHRDVQLSLKRSMQNLEESVLQRTSELIKTNAKLQAGIVEQERMEAALAHSLKIQKMLTVISSRFVNSSDFDQAVTETLGELCTAWGASRAYLYRFSHHDLQMNNTHFWCSGNADTPQTVLKIIPLKDYPWWLEQFEARQSVHISDFSEIPVGASAEKEFLKNYQIESLLAVPVTVRQELTGFIGMDSLSVPADWDELTIDSFRIVAEIIGSALHRRQATADLRKSEERYRHFFEDDLTGDFISTPDGQLLDCNPAYARMLGFESIEEAKSQSTISFYADPSVRENFLELLHQKKRVESFELEMVRKDGKRLFVIENVIGNFDPSGNLVQIKGYLFDITDRVKLEEQFRQAQKMEAIGRLAGGVAHDFNNLLTIINGYAELMMTRLEPGNPMHMEVEQILKAGDNASALTSQLLAFSRRQIVQPAVLNLNDVMKNMEYMLRRLIGEDIRLETILTPGIPNIRADVGHLEQIIMNLAVNARDAMSGGGQLTIQTSYLEIDNTYATSPEAIRPGTYVMMAVSDSGAGMNAETRAHLFEPFFTTKEMGKGTGLGLSTVYGIVKQHNGYIWVYSEPGEGTTFKLYFPATSDEVHPVKRRPQNIKSTCGTESILLAEDDEMVRNLAATVLEASGYKVHSAGTGREALDICQTGQHEFQILLSDVVMPEMGGGELAQKVMKLFPDIRVLLISGYTEETVVNKFILNEGVHFLQKPFTAEQLTQKVRAVLDQ